MQLQAIRPHSGDLDTVGSSSGDDDAGSRGDTTTDSDAPSTPPTRAATSAITIATCWPVNVSEIPSALTASPLPTRPSPRLTARRSRALPVQPAAPVTSYGRRERSGTVPAGRPYALRPWREHELTTASQELVALPVGSLRDTCTRILRIAPDGLGMPSRPKHLGERRCPSPRVGFPPWLDLAAPRLQ
jgi:hypothetical protein